MIIIMYLYIHDTILENCLYNIFTHSNQQENSNDI